MAEMWVEIGISLLSKKCPIKLHKISGCKGRLLIFLFQFKDSRQVWWHAFFDPGVNEVCSKLKAVEVKCVVGLVEIDLKLKLSWKLPEIWNETICQPLC